jgi:hypothetical protein
MCRIDDDTQTWRRWRGSEEACFFAREFTPLRKHIGLRGRCARMPEVSSAMANFGPCFPPPFEAAAPRPAPPYVALVLWQATAWEAYKNASWTLQPTPTRNYNTPRLSTEQWPIHPLTLRHLVSKNAPRNAFRNRTTQTSIHTVRCANGATSTSLRTRPA